MKTVFIVPLHPKTEAGEPHRLNLFRLCLKSLTRQTHQDWVAYVVGVPGEAWDEEVVKLRDHRILRVQWARPKEVTPTSGSEPTAAGDKPDKILKVVKILGGYDGFVALLDDDDWFSSGILERVEQGGPFMFKGSTSGIDRIAGYFDFWQLFYEWDNKRYVRQNRGWTPNTTIMRFQDCKDFLHLHHADFKKNIPGRWMTGVAGDYVYCRVIHQDAVNGHKWERQSAPHKQLVYTKPPRGFTCPR